MDVYFSILLGILVFACWAPLELIRQLAYNRYMKIKDKALLGDKELSNYLRASILRDKEEYSNLEYDEIINKTMALLRGRADSFKAILDRNKLIALCALSIIMAILGVVFLVLGNLVIGLTNIFIVLIGLRVYFSYRGILKWQRKEIEVLESRG